MLNEFAWSTAVFVMLLLSSAIGEAVGKKKGKNWDLVGPFLTCWLAAPVLIFLFKHFRYPDLNVFLWIVCPVIHVAVTAFVFVVVAVTLTLGGWFRNSRR